MICQNYSQGWAFKSHVGCILCTTTDDLNYDRTYGVSHTVEIFLSGRRAKRSIFLIKTRGKQVKRGIFSKKKRDNQDKQGIFPIKKQDNQGKRGIFLFK